MGEIDIKTDLAQLNLEIQLSMVIRLTRIA